MFNRLPHLPLELRLQIWAQTLEDELLQPRMAFVKVDQAEDVPLFAPTHEDERWQIRDPLVDVVRGRCSPLLHTCMEAQDVLMRSLKQLSTSRVQHCFAPNDTILLLPSTCPQEDLEYNLRVPDAPYHLLHRLQVRSVAVLLHKESYNSWDNSGFWQNLPSCVNEVILLEVGGPVREITPSIAELELDQHKFGRNLTHRSYLFTSWIPRHSERDPDFYSFDAPARQSGYWTTETRENAPEAYIQDSYIWPEVKLTKDTHQVFQWFDEALCKFRASGREIPSRGSLVVRYVLIPGDPFLANSP
ncbi:hypothetical protein LIA77_03271 [Sarocladium implicatum]|nr:hypothetical protein LIA77_03271 [Sarocladium implicatum]